MELLDIYLAGPYSSPEFAVQCERYHAHVEAAAKLLRLGYTVIAPIVFWHPLAVAHELPTDAGFWEVQNKWYLRHCKLLVMLDIPGWQESEGLRTERLYAYERAIPIRLFSAFSKSVLVME